MTLDTMLYSRVRILIAEKEVREQRRISYRTIAKETGLSLATVTAYASGTNTRYDGPTIEAFCQYFNCQPGDLLVYSDTRP
jgi:putative transcriptional regulator